MTPSHGNVNRLEVHDMSDARETTNRMIALGTTEIGNSFERVFTRKLD